MIWIIYCTVEGILHGLFYHNRLQSKFPQFKFAGIILNEHVLWNICRFILAFWLVYRVYDPGRIWDQPWIWQAVFIFCVQPFFHNGAYYTTRNLLNRDTYPKRWLDHSTTSTSKFTRFFGPGTRVFFLIFGLTSLYISYQL